jgi:predicted Zn-dependent peptidase
VAESGNTVFRREVLPNGMTVVIKSNPDSRVFALNVIGKNRSASEPEGKTGITDFVNRMIKKGTKTLSAEALANRLASIGAEGVFR